MSLTSLIDQSNSHARQGAALPCQGGSAGDAELWFSETPAQIEQAKALCLDCPVRAQCLAMALEQGEPWGVWGGELFEAGRVIPRKRPRGRPRKDDPYRVAA